MQKLPRALSIDHCLLTISCLQYSPKEGSFILHGTKTSGQSSINYLTSRGFSLKMELNLGNVIFSFTHSLALLITVGSIAIH